MIPHWLTGNDASALIRYITHDAPTGADPRPRSAERVAWVRTENAGPADDPAQAVAEIEQLIADAPALKAAAGISSRGRKSKKTMGHLILSWERGADVDPEHAIDVGQQALAALGLKDHAAVMAFHEDKRHPHLHIAVCRIHPETGRTINKRNPAQRLSAFARDYERQHGIVVPRREAIAQAREDRLAAEPGSAGHQQASDLERVLRRRRQRRRGPGRPRRPRWEQRMWAIGRGAGSPDHETKRAIAERRAERLEELRNAQDQRACAAAIARTWPSLSSGTLELAARHLGESEQDDVARLGAAACRHLSRRRRIHAEVSTLQAATASAIRRTVENTLRSRGRAVAAAAAAAAPRRTRQRRQTQTPDRSGQSRSKAR